MVSVDHLALLTAPQVRTGLYDACSGLEVQEGRDEGDVWHVENLGAMPERCGPVRREKCQQAAAWKRFAGP